MWRHGREFGWFAGVDVDLAVAQPEAYSPLQYDTIGAGQGRPRLRHGRSLGSSGGTASLRVGGAAVAVTRRAGAVAEHVDFAAVNELSQVAVDGGQPDGGPWARS
jgi:hypothetical protein